MAIGSFFSSVGYAFNTVLSIQIGGFSISTLIISGFIAACTMSLIRKRSNH